MQGRCDTLCQSYWLPTIYKKAIQNIHSAWILTNLVLNEKKTNHLESIVDVNFFEIQ